MHSAVRYPPSGLDRSAGQAPRNPVEQGGFRPASGADLAAARATRAARRAAWPAVRQPHPDDRDYLKAILREHGLRQIPTAEPASVDRLRQLLRRAGVSQTHAEAAVGLTLEKLIEKNPGAALWWITATTLEAAA